MEFSKLLEINLNHDYYQGPSQDLRCALLSPSSRLLNTGAIRLVNQPGGISLYFKKRADNNPVNSIAGATLQIAVVVTNPAFAVVTDLGAAENQLPIYRNTLSPDSFDVAVNYQNVGGRFSYPLQFGTRPATVQLLSDAGEQIESHAITADMQASTQSLLLEKQGPGFYRINEAAGADNAQTLVSYQPQLPAQSIALLEIKIDASFYTAPPAFGLQFAARSDTLNYYIIASNYSDTEFGNLTLTDAGFAEQSRSEITFSRLESTSFGDSQISPELLNSNNSKVTLFHSQASISRRQQGPKKLQLKLDGDVLISSLPTPGSTSAKADFFIHLAKP
ncbi:hypothetical protein ACFSJ3_12760 [Corallincola platygyrae]|uniref:DUF4397 domain-containing protein n=1 Tax=Corallincola platygyrae TaxID=1193278 RepID=A0ABW4XMQ4_9GAMM